MSAWPAQLVRASGPVQGSSDCRPGPAVMGDAATWEALAAGSRGVTGPLLLAGAYWLTFQLARTSARAAGMRATAAMEAARGRMLSMGDSSKRRVSRLHAKGILLAAGREKALEAHEIVDVEQRRPGAAVAVGGGVAR